MQSLPVWLTRVQSHSMAPGLRDGQFVWTVRPRRLRRGAVVAVDSRQVGRRIVKRIVGLPGEHIHLDGRRVLVDGHVLPEPYASASTYRGDFHVPAGHYLLLGDNRDASTDARSWDDPYVGGSEIVGVLLGQGRGRRVEDSLGRSRYGSCGPDATRSIPGTLSPRRRDPARTPRRRRG